MQMKRMLQNKQIMLKKEKYKLDMFCIKLRKKNKKIKKIKKNNNKKKHARWDKIPQSSD